MIFKRTPKKLLQALGTLLLGNPLLGWWESGHMTVALIARDHLRPATLRWINEVAACPLDGRKVPEQLLFASVWPDLIKLRGLTAMDNWHYLSQPLDPGKVLSATEAASLQNGTGTTITAALEQCARTLAAPRAGAWEKAFALSWVIHLVADVHQPLHGATLIGPHAKEGDLGGMRFPLPLPKTPNLHFLWDSAFGILPDVRWSQLGGKGGDKRKRRMEACARKLQRTLPRSCFPELLQEAPKDWAKASFRLAQAAAYDGIEPGKPPSGAYLARGQKEAARQLVLAGYRLADLLNRLCPVPNRSEGVCK